MGTFQEGFESSEGDRQPFEAHPDSMTGDVRTIHSSETADRHPQLTLDCPRPQFSDKLVQTRHFNRGNIYFQLAIVHSRACCLQSSKLVISPRSRHVHHIRCMVRFPTADRYSALGAPFTTALYLKAVHRGSVHRLEHIVY